MSRALHPLAVDLGGSHLIEASAGTGKTYAIATLYVRFLLEANLRTSEILVVTYTNAATAELRLRIRDRIRRTLTALATGHWDGDETLDAFIRGRREAGVAALQRDRALLLAALHSFDEASIFTIHGFCQRVLHESAFETGTAFDTELLANLRGLVDEVVNDFWVGRLHDAPEDFVRHLRSKPNPTSPETLQRIAAALVTHPDIPVLPSLEEVLGDDHRLTAPALRFRREFVDYARIELRRRKQAARVQSFDDLLQRLCQALAAPGGDTLAHALRQRYRAALVDEFQDTDPIQYDIFRRIYADAGAPLFLIGDPKQAIYAFRGADVFTYMDAERDAASTHTLLTNRRSDPSLLRAINTIFQRAAPAFLFDDIGYESIEPVAGAHDRLGGSRRGKAPFEILFVERRGLEVSSRKPHTVLSDESNTFVTIAVADRIAAFLGEGATLLLESGERPLLPSDVAVLCRRNREAADVQEALRALQIHAVLQSDATVFETAEATAVERTLQALANPVDSRALRGALASPLIGLDASDLHALERDEVAWETWAGRFRDWHDLWMSRDFVVAFRRMLDELDVEKRLLRCTGGERRLTDVLHLVELLHRASVDQRLGPQALVHWLALMRTDAGARAELLGEAARVRLESDEAAVKLVTIHRSKGLEYPVVFCPFSWGASSLHPHEKTALRFHDDKDRDRLKLDLGSPQHGMHQKRAEHEVLAENLRLLYVAFTRAKHYCGVVWGGLSGSPTSALGYLLHQRPGGGIEETVAATAGRLKEVTDDQLLAELNELKAASADCIEIVPLRAGHRPATPQAAATRERLVAPEVRGRIHALWRTSSFSALTAAPAAVLSLPDEEGLDHDTEQAPASSDGAATAIGTPVVGLPFADLPIGARTGQIIHAILEKLDFQFGATAELRTRLDRLLPRTGPERAWLDTLTEGIENVLDTPLGNSAGPLRLRQVSTKSRLNELEFLLPVGARRHPSLTVAKLAAVFERHALTPAQSEYAQRVTQLGFGALEGYLRGFIDMIFEHAGKWYLVDYKSNRLGFSVAGYASTRLDEVMSLHHYRLQYHLYALALHRYLNRRLDAYDYEKHFGGVYYLFLRGMSPHHPDGCGIYYDRPTLQLIDDLSSLLAPPSDSLSPTEHPPVAPREGGKGDRR